MLIAVTPDFYRQPDAIWGSVTADWESTLSRRFTVDQLKQAVLFLQAVNEMSTRHLERLRSAGQ
ncbi:MAG: hypothetical protein ACSLE6_09560 [Mycobacterium sp.]